MRPRWPIPLILLLPLASCSNEYVCPDPIGAIIRDDCEAYRTRYESLKVQLSFSVGGIGVSAGAGKEKLRDPSELLQLLMQQTMALCRDFNSCRVVPDDYRRRREDADRKFTAITAISQQLKGDLDAESKRQLVAKLIDVLTDAPVSPRRSVARPRPSAPRCKRVLYSATSLYFGGRFQPPMPKLPEGVPALAWWEMTRAGGIGHVDTYVHLTLRGKTDADDVIYLSLSQDGGKELREKVRSRPGREEARASFKLRDKLLREEGTMTLAYRVGATLKKHGMGTVDLDWRRWRGRGYLAYMPDPVNSCTGEYERPWLVFFTRTGNKAKVTVRCDHDGKPVPGVLEGRDTSGANRVSHLERRHVALPIRIPLKGGRARGSWTARLPGEEVPVDKLPDEAKGLWRCRVAVNGRTARRLEFRLRPDGSVVPQGRAGIVSPPWWPVKTEAVDNEVERERDRELAKEAAKLRGQLERLRR